MVAIQFTTMTSVFGGAEHEDIEKKYITTETVVQRLYMTRWIRRKSTRTIAIKDALYYLYTAPFSIFALNTISFMVLLLLFSYFVLVTLEENITALELFLWFWMGTLIAEEIRQLLTEKKPSMLKKLVYWAKNKWNSMDILMYGLLIFSVILRNVLTGPSFQYARAFYSITVAVFYIRFMQFFYVSRSIGPKVIMIKKMLLDLKDFLPILVVFMVSVGILYQANLFPNSQVSFEILSNPYRQIFGDIAFDYLEGDAASTCSYNESSLPLEGITERCPHKNWMVPFFGAVYLLLTNILLLNLLIAKFSFTFQSVQQNSNEVWQFYRYSIVHEYSRRPILPPPVNVIELAYRATFAIGSRLRNESGQSNENKITRLDMLLSSAVKAYLEKKKSQ